MRELNSAANIFYELQNEPWSDNHTIGELINPYLMTVRKFPNVVENTAPVSVEWQARVATWISDTEAALLRKQLIAQDISIFRFAVRGDDLAPGCMASCRATFNCGHGS